MKYAVIADVHSNLEALERALEEIRKRNVDHVISLGDVVGYGANPSECLKLVCETADETIMGNHDQAVEDVQLRNYFSDWAREAIAWTTEHLRCEEKKQIRKFTPLAIDKKADVTWTHGSIHEPGEFHYLFSEQDAKPSFRSLETRIGFFGHTHIPTLFLGSGEVRYLPAGIYELPRTSRVLINPGSVGQPRDRNPKLGQNPETEALCQTS